MTFSISKCTHSILTVFPLKQQAASLFFLHFPRHSHHSCNFFLLVTGKQDQGKQRNTQGFVEHGYAERRFRWQKRCDGGFTLCRLDFGSCSGFTPATVRRKKKRPRHLHLTDWLVDDSLPGTDISAWESLLGPVFSQKLFPHRGFIDTSASYLFDLFAPLFFISPLFHLTPFSSPTFFLKMLVHLLFLNSEGVLSFARGPMNRFLDPYHRQH